MSFPTPVGGTPFPSDFVPSVLFAVLYALLVPVVLYRAYDKRSRTLLLIGTTIFGIERVVLFSLRAAQSRNESQQMSKGLLTYTQGSLGVGFISIANDLVNIVRVLLVNPTYGSETYSECPAAASNSSIEHSPPQRLGEFPGEPPNGTPDHPRQRFWSRRFSDFTNLAFLSAIIPGILGHSNFHSAINDPAAGHRAMLLRYVSCGVGLFLTCILTMAAVWAHLKLPRVSRKGASILLCLAMLLSTVAIYRLSVMFNTTSSLSSTASGSLNSIGAKRSFYILHVLPEWLAVATMLICNIRRIYGTGIFGDWHNADETQEERKKREKKEAKRAKERGPPKTGDSHSLETNVDVVESEPGETTRLV